MKKRQLKSALLMSLFLSIGLTTSGCFQVMMLAEEVERRKTRNRHQEEQTEVQWRTSNAPRKREEIKGLKVKSITEYIGRYKKGKLKGKERVRFYEAFAPNGNRIECKSQEIFLGYLNYAFVAQYDSMGRLIQRSTSHNKNGKPKFRTLYEYDVAGVLVKEFISDVKQGMPLREIHYKYNDAGRLVLKRVLKSTSHATNSGKRVFDGLKLSNETRYKYDDHQRLTQLRSIKIDGAKSRTQKYEYNDAGQLISRSTVTDKGSIFESFEYGPNDSLKTKVIRGQNELRYNFAYNDEGKLARTVWTNTDLKKNKIINFKSEIDYETNGLKKEIRLFQEGDLFYKTRYVYEYYTVESGA